MLVLISVLLAAAPTGHRARADRAEALGRMQEAAREYEAAWDEEQAPELLYRLGLARRKLKQYAKAREAFRAYLRAAPEGGLREEVLRQLAKVEVLIEAQAEDYSEEEKPRRPAARSGEQRSPVQREEVNGVHQIGEQRSPAQREEVNIVHQDPPPVPAEVAAAPVAAPDRSPAIPAPPPAPSAPSVALDPAATPAAPPVTIALAAAPDPSQAIPAPLAPAIPVVAPQPAAPVPARSRAAPWLAAGAAAAAGAGAYFWWDGARVARDLDTRYAAGDLAAADRPLFGRARGESLAGRALVATGTVLLATAVALWW